MGNHPFRSTWDNKLELIIRETMKTQKAELKCLDNILMKPNIISSC